MARATISALSMRALTPAADRTMRGRTIHRRAYRTDAGRRRSKGGPVLRFFGESPIALTTFTKMSRSGAC
jgi:hypothetical protein